jgi:hypothetical protein
VVHRGIAEVPCGDVRRNGLPDHARGLIDICIPVDEPVRLRLLQPVGAGPDETGGSRSPGMGVISGAS